MTARILLLMTTRTYRAGAFLEAAERLGLDVVIGSDQPQIFGGARSGKFLDLNFNDPDAAVDTILDFARINPLKAIIPAEDEEIIPAIRSSEILGTSSNPGQAGEIARDKHSMRQVLSQAGVPVPKFELAELTRDPEGLAERVRYPCVLKPRFLSASRGVIRVDNPAQFVQAFQHIAWILQDSALKAEGGHLALSLLVEEYIPGVEVALEGLLIEGQLKVLAIFDKPDPLEGPYFEETIYVTPSRLSQEDQQLIIDTTARAARAIGLQDGPIHAELRLNEKGAWMIEIAPRTIGGLCSQCLRFYEGITLEELILRHAVGLPVDRIERENLAAGVMMIPIPRQGILTAVHGKNEALEIPGVESVIITVPLDSEVVPLPAGNRYLGFIFARGENPETVEASLRHAHARLDFDIQSP